MKNKFQLFVLTLLILCCFSPNLLAQVTIIGSTNVTVSDDAKTYTAYPEQGLSITKSIWQVTGGTVLSQTTTSVSIQWTTAGTGQELPTIVPLSPNAASIVKYSEIPIGHFTGVPNIIIPLDIIETSELKLPLTLSYHAGGNKVKSVASWVDLGWSLGTVPSIFRNVKGIHDDNNGYFSTYAGRTVEELWNLGISSQIYNNYRQDLFSGNADPEPDIFNYDLPTGSGTFFYNQELETFISHPTSNTKIIRDGSNFMITTPDGTSIVSLWGYNQQYPVAKIENATYTDAISFVSQSILDEPTNSDSLRSELQKIRTGLPNTMVTTYNPLISITSTTDLGVIPLIMNTMSLIG